MKNLRLVALLPLLLLLMPAVSTADTPPPGAGFIYATVTWPSGDAKTGFLRWGQEEAFWDDLFNCGYRDLVWSDYADLEQLRKDRRAEYYRTHGLINRLIYAMDRDHENPMGWRMFVSRFGDLRSIEIHDGEDDFAVTADGARHQIGGYDRDAGSFLYLYVADREPERIRWNDLSEIVFQPAPADARPYADRLYGVVETTEGAFEGYIQWDQSECTTSDLLDGRENDEKVRLPMGDVRSISRRRDGASDVVTSDGIPHNLRGDNDVNPDNRGIMVEVADLGRVTVPWNRFRSATFSNDRGSGPGRTTYANAAPLQGAVSDTEGRVLSGRLVFDLDEAFAWDLFNGSDARDIAYDIPFANLVRIESGADNRCRVTLRSGLVLELGDDQDTGRDNAGLLIFGDRSDEPEHVPWSRVRSVDFRP